YCNKCGTPNSVEGQFCSRCGSALTAAQSPAAAPAVPYTPVGAAAVGYGGFWIRVVALIIDGIIVRAVAWPVSMIFGLGGLAGMMGGFPHGAVDLHLFGGSVMLMLVIFGSWLYEAFMLSSPYQATLGKMILGMKVTDLSGNRISFARATGRHFAKWLSGMILGVGYIMVGFTERKQGLHDMLAGTLVRQ
ncbi:MAG TPA: RDD family protein, partial [Terriglobales bacterium]|nr:RDD family protein [Terriglobales bacterium]